MLIKGRLRIDVKDRDGRVIKTVEQPMRSFVANFLRFLYTIFATEQGVSTTQTTIQDIDGTARTYPDLGSQAFYTFHGGKAPSGNGNYGILVSPNTDPTLMDHKTLPYRYTEGTASGQMHYGQTEVIEPEIGTNYARLKIIRPIYNQSGVTQTIGSVALVLRGRHTTGGFNFLIARDVLSTPIDLADGQTAVVTYIIEITL